MAWRLPVGEMLFRLDHLSAFFLIPVMIVAVCVSLYTCGYCSTTPDNRAEARLTFYLGLVIGAIILLLAASGITLLIFWEIMALMVYLAMCLEHGLFCQGLPWVNPAARCPNRTNHRP